MAKDGRILNTSLEFQDKREGDKFPNTSFPYAHLETKTINSSTSQEHRQHLHTRKHIYVYMSSTRIRQLHLRKIQDFGGREWRNDPVSLSLFDGLYKMVNQKQYDQKCDDTKP